MIKVEEWRAIPGYEGFYEVSNLGRVKSLGRVVERKNNRSHSVRGGILKLGEKNGYVQTKLTIANVRRDKNVHVLVASAFIGPRPEGLIVLHGENGKLDNSVGNLSYGTYKQNNAQDRHRDGTACTGEKHYNAVLTVEKIWLARAIVPNGPRGTLRRLAAEWGVTDATLSLAVSGKSWAYV